jgi:uncharacterized membrane protein
MEGGFMEKLLSLKPYVPDPEPIKNINDVIDSQCGICQRAAVWVARNLGSWTFLISQSIVFTIWTALNITAWVRHWDPYPFILMNLILSLQAAYAAPIIMMSQNRQAVRDRLEAHNDYLVNKRTAEEVRIMLECMAAQNEALLAIHESLRQLRGESETTAPST